MNEPSALAYPIATRPAQGRIATKILAFSVSAIFVTALVISAIASHAAYRDLRRSIEETLPALLARTAEAIEAEPERQLGDLPGVQTLLDAHTHGGLYTLLLLDGHRQLLASSSAGAEKLVRRAGAPGALIGTLATGSRGRVRELTSADGAHWFACARFVGDEGWVLAVVSPFERVFEPLLSLVSCVLMADLAVILVFSLLALRVSENIMRPIGVISGGAQRIARGELDHEIPDPERPDEIGLLARSVNEMLKKLRSTQLEIQEKNEQLLDQNHELQSANEVLAQLSITDGLTKLHNHRFFQDHLSREIKRISRSREPLSILLVDLDDFKSLNDRLGHACGDEILVRVAQIMDANVRETDLLARYGGEEFVVLAAGTDLAGAETLAEKIRMAVADGIYHLEGSPLAVGAITVSIGVAQFAGDRKRFFRAADLALYRAKADGKNCVVTWCGESA